MKIIKNYDEFQSLANQDLVIIIAKTKTCAVCHPLTDKLISFMKDYDSIPYYELYLEDVELFQGQNLVFTVPTVLVYSKGKEILRESRFIDFEKIERLFNLYLDNKE
jgi:thiol-disulfide isomerase/thioredoxin